MPDLLIGCSGFSYPHWRGPFYPEKLAAKQWVLSPAETGLVRSLAGQHIGRFFLCGEGEPIHHAPQAMTCHLLVVIRQPSRSG